MCFDVSIPIRLIWSTDGLPLSEINSNDLILAHSMPRGPSTPTTVVSPAAISEKPPDSWLSRSKDTIEAGTFDISPVETGELGGERSECRDAGAVTFDKMGFCQKSGSLPA